MNTAGLVDLARCLDRIAAARTVERRGRVVQVVGLAVESVGPAVEVGELCYIHPRAGGARLAAEVVGFRGDRVILLPFGEMRGIAPGCRVTAAGHGLVAGVGSGLLGRVLDGLGRPLDGRPRWTVEARREVHGDPPSPLERERIHEPLHVGVRAVDGLLTIGRGQRVGIFAGSGVGKSTLLGMLARGATSDVNVIALVGERGREVRDFLEGDLGPEALTRSVVVAATSEQPALVRLNAAFLATAIAEYFRDQGRHVLLLMDSLTRFAMAQREVGLAAGEPPTAKGYTPSVFALLPRLLERAGTAERGSITGFYTVLVDGDDMNEPIADAARSILDGHIVLSRDLAGRGHYPSIDVLQSVSRVMDEVTDQEHRRAALEFRRILAVYRDAEDLINIGAYRQGANPAIDRARTLIAPMEAFLRQDAREVCPFAETRAHLLNLLGREVDAVGVPLSPAAGAGRGRPGRAGGRK